MTKRYELIHLNGQIYAVDKELPILPFDWFLEWDSIDKKYVLIQCKDNGWQSDKASRLKTCQKIVMSSDPSLGLPLLPAIEGDYLTAFNEAFPKASNLRSHDYEVLLDGFMEGYKVAKAKQFTEEDMMKCWIEAERSDAGRFPDFKQFIQSLKPKPKFVWLILENNVPLIENGYVKVEKWEY